MLSLLIISGLQNISIFANAEKSGLHMGHFKNYTQYENAATFGRLSAANETSVAKAKGKAILPEEFDLRKLGLVSSVKNQKNTGMCWSFSALCTIETGLIARQPWINLSEWHLGYYTYSEKFGFPLRNGGSGSNDAFQQGGNFYMLSPMLTGWLGPVSESLFPFEDESVLDAELDWDYWKSCAEYHVSDANMYYYYPEEDVFPEQIEAIKEAIYQGHSVSMSYYNKINNCYNAKTNAYYFDEDEKIDGNYHAVTIVGWDDNFSAENFNTNPGMNGAWLVKNSWGASWGSDYGYFWISYADPSMTEFYYLETENLQKHDAIYQYDDYGYWTAFSVSETDDSSYVANVFTAEKDTYLTSVMLCNVMPNEKYNIQIYQDLNNAINPVSGISSVETTGILRTAGYHTVDLAQPVALRAGEKFSIVVKFSGDSGQHIACEAYMKNTITMPDGSVSFDENMLTEEMIYKDFHAGESFYSMDGKEWYDIYDQETIDDVYELEDGTQIASYAVLGNICVRGLTQDAGVVIFSEESDYLPVGTEINLTSSEQGEIYYSINNNEEVLYTGPIIMPEENITISAYVIANNQKYAIYEKKYQIQEAMCSSLLFIDDENVSYLDFEKNDVNEYVTTYIPSEDTSQIKLLPMTTGQVDYQGQELNSGVATRLKNWQGENKLVLHVSQEGMQDTNYIIYLQEFALGDVNADGIINADDAADILVYSTKFAIGEILEKSTDWFKRADYNQDGNINTEDASEILIYATEFGAGLID